MRKKPPVVKTRHTNYQFIVRSIRGGGNLGVIGRGSHALGGSQVLGIGRTARAEGDSDFWKGRKHMLASDSRGTHLVRALE